jgi:prepilin peptidase CpaA
LRQIGVSRPPAWSLDGKFPFLFLALSGSGCVLSRVLGHMLKQGVWMLAAAFAAAAGWSDWRSRRIPNWLTVSGLLLGIAANSLARGWMGAKDALLGAGLGLIVLLPFVMLRSLGAGDWKLVGAVGAFLGPGQLLTVLLGAILVAGLMAVALIIWKKRVGQTLRNLGKMLAAFLTFHRPGPELTLENPEALKIPFGVAVAVTVVVYSARRAWGVW